VLSPVSKLGSQYFIAGNHTELKIHHRITSSTAISCVLVILFTREYLECTEFVFFQNEGEMAGF
jgi:hypothetical protein